MGNVRDFGAAGDGQTDDTGAIEHALKDGDGEVVFPRGDYAISRSLVVDLAKLGRASFSGAGGTAKLIMRGGGPAILLLGSHSGSADPDDFRPAEWQRERMPTISNLEIEGAHPQADGIRIEGVIQPTLSGVLIRRVRHALHVTKRARNLVVSHCHFYHNTGIGVFLDHVDLHQTIIVGSHISYCRQGGIRIAGGEIRNLQITGNDIEYNTNKAHRVAGADDEATADVYFDVENGSIREGTISGNTIQATRTPGGANIRFVGRGKEQNHQGGMWTISGNLIGSQDVNLHLTGVRDVSITGNMIYSGHRRNLLLEDSRNVTIGANTFGHNPDYKLNELATGIRLVGCENCNLSGVLIQDARESRHTVPDAPPLERQGLVELIRCGGLSLSGCQILDGAPYGLYLDDCNHTLINGCTVLDGRKPRLMRAAIRWIGLGRGNLVSGSRIGLGLDGSIIADGTVELAANLLDG